MEHVIVKFTQDRAVFIDGEENGRTNEILRIGTGIHVFSLGEPNNYAPEEIEQVVDDTSAINPLEIVFQEV